MLTIIICQPHRLLDRLFLLLLLAGIVSCCGGVLAEGQNYKRGVLLEDNLEFPCSHECGPFEPVYFSFCVQDGDQVYLARIFDTRFNYDPNKLRPLVGKAIQFRNDANHIWIVRPDGKEFGLKQDYSNGFFLKDQCVSELHHHLLRDRALSRPPDVEPDAVYVPVNRLIGYWTKCFLAKDRAIVCQARGPKGEEFSHVYQAQPEATSNSDLIVDPFRTNYENIVLANGQTLIRKND